MSEVDGHGVVIVGAGQAGGQLAVSLRERDPDVAITLVGDEAELPYRRPPLSKHFAKRRLEPAHVRLRPAEFFAEQRIRVVHDRAVTLDVVRRTVRLASGAELPYGEAVLATGSRARTLPVPGADAPGVFTVRTLADAVGLHERLPAAQHAVVAGGGFLGIEAGAALRQAGLQVALVELAPRLLARSTSVELADHVAACHRAQGVRVLLGAAVTEIVTGPDRSVSAVRLADGTRLPAELVVVAVGASPDTDVAVASGLPVDDGVLVDQWLRVPGQPSVSAIGDCARFLAPWSAARVRLESVQNAVDQARYVAARIEGADRAPYRTVPWFWSQQFDLRLQTVGVTEPGDVTELVGDVASGSFSLRRHRHGRLVAVESVNHPAEHIAARRQLEADLVTGRGDGAAALG